MRATGVLPTGLRPEKIFREKILIVVPLLAVLALPGCAAAPGLGGASDAINAPVCQEQSEMAAMGVVGDGTMSITCP